MQASRFLPSALEEQCTWNARSKPLQGRHQVSEASSTTSCCACSLSTQSNSSSLQMKFTSPLFNCAHHHLLLTRAGQAALRLQHTLAQSLTSSRGPRISGKQVTHYCG